MPVFNSCHLVDGFFHIGKHQQEEGLCKREADQFIRDLEFCTLAVLSSRYTI